VVAHALGLGEIEFYPDKDLPQVTKGWLGDISCDAIQMVIKQLQGLFAKFRMGVERRVDKDRPSTHP
jgi:hypothetical protein